MAPFLLDTETRGTNANLNSHVGESGHGYVYHPGNGGTLTVQASTDTVRLSAVIGSFALAYSTAVPPSADYDVDGVFPFYTAQAGQQSAVCGRLDTTVQTFYAAIAAGTGASVQLWKFVAGSAAAFLGAYTFPVAKTGGAEATVTLRMRGARISLLVDGVEQVVYNDPDPITAAGRPGIRAVGVVAASVGVQLSSISATEITTSVAPTGGADAGGTAPAGRTAAEGGAALTGGSPTGGAAPAATGGAEAAASSPGAAHHALAGGGQAAGTAPGSSGVAARGGGGGGYHDFGIAAQLPQGRALAAAVAPRALVPSTTGQALAGGNPLVRRVFAAAEVGRAAGRAGTLATARPRALQAGQRPRSSR
jgi:hypothetical protein